VRGEQYNKLNKGSYFSTSCRKERVNLECENKEFTERRVLRSLSEECNQGGDKEM
jgi:hypothetical protein